MLVMGVAEGEDPVGCSAPSEEPHSPPRRKSSMRQVYDRVQKYLVSDATTSDSSGTINTSSPVNKRRGFSGRKWLPPPLRKLSQGKVEKGQAQDNRPPLKKKGSDNKFKLPTDMGNKPSVSEGEDDEDRSHGRGLISVTSPEPSGANDEPEDEILPEFPPPMKPIQEPILVATAGPAGVPTIEENPGKREQHTENQERNSILRDTKSSDALTESEDSKGEAAGSAASQNSEETEKVPESLSSAESHLKRRNFALKELEETELAYVNDLALMVEGYIVQMRDPNCDIPMPDDLKSGKDKMIFGNIEAIFEWHRDFFYKQLKVAVDNPKNLGPLFKRYERKLRMYVVYCQNKPVSEYIVSEHESYFEELRQKLGHKLQLGDLLIKPVQRITKYQLLLKDISKHTERAGLQEEVEALRAALEVMEVVPKEANEMMDVGRLQGFDGKITSQGTLLLHGPLICVEGGANPNTLMGRSKELQVFLFEQTIIFSEAVGKKTQFTSPRYIYKAHMQVNKLTIEESVKSAEDWFALRSTDPMKPNVAYVCQPTTPELKDQWVATINNILQKQKDFLKAIQSPIDYQKKLTHVSDSPDWSPTLRKTVSIPAQPTQPMVDAKMSRKTTHAVHKANTIGIPSDADLANNSGNNMRSANKPKLNFLGGFRNTLKNKHKSDVPVSTQSKEDSGNKNDFPRRWSEANPACESNSVMAPGSPARVVCEWPDMFLGEVVQIIRYDPRQGYLVRSSNHLEELWLPAHVLSNHNRKPWTFRFRKPSFTGPGRRSIDCSENIITEVSVPDFQDKIKDVTAQCGSRVVFKTRVKPCGHNVKVSWRKTEPDPCVMRNGGRFTLGFTDNGVATLAINNARVSDSGSYLCTVANEVGSTQCSAHLIVTDYLPVAEPKIQVISSSSVLLEWENDGLSNNPQYLVEYCKLGTGEWMSANNQMPICNNSYTVEHLIPGETYSFRVILAHSKLVGLPSVAVTLPVADSLRWQQEQFKRRYVELEEIGRGRFCVVRRAKDRGTGQEVALKQVLRRKQEHKVTQAEYALLAGMQHVNIIRAMALFDNAPLPGLDTVILELVRGPLLFTYISQRDEYTESEVSSYIRQLMSALAWLHAKDVAHLDVKPENVMVDVTNSLPVVKLIDFGDCVNVSGPEILPPACLEFASPELVLGQPVGIHTDLWACGVFLYVLLSGVSPFLDDSVEETTANILKCDYCFPEEYFKDVSLEAKDLIRKLLVLIPSQRSSMVNCLESVWINQVAGLCVVPSIRLHTFMERRHPLNPPASKCSTGILD